jgi:hypothetical protein
VPSAVGLGRVKASKVKVPCAPGRPIARVAALPAFALAAQNSDPHTGRARQALFLKGDKTKDPNLFRAELPEDKFGEPSMRPS